MGVLRRLVWSDMDEQARAELCARGLADIFDPDLRRSITALVDDVRERGDEAVCDALARFDGVHVDPDGLQVSDDELDAARVDPALDAAIDDAVAHLRAFNEHQEAVRKIARGFGFDDIRVNTHEWLGPAMAAFVARRNAQIKRSKAG